MHNLLTIFAQSSTDYDAYTDEQALGAFGALFAVFGIFLLVGIIAAIIFYVLPMFFIFSKAGQPGWAAIIPIYNVWILSKVVGRNPVIVLGGFVGASLLGGVTGGVLSFLVLPITFILMYDLAMVFGYSSGFSITNGILGVLSIPVTNFAIAFGDNPYQGPLARSNERWLMDSPWIDPNLGGTAPNTNPYTN